MSVTFDYLIVLGGKVRGREGLSRVVKQRLDAALRICKRHKIGRIIVTGGVTSGLSPFSEAEIMRRYLVKKGIRDSRIIKEERAENTIGNAFYSRRRMAKKNARIIIVTSDYHARRALFVFGHFFRRGFAVVGAGSGRMGSTSAYEKASMRYAKANLRGITASTPESRVVGVLGYLHGHPQSEEMRRLSWY